MHIVMFLSKPVRTDARVRREAAALQAAGHRLTLVQWGRHDPDAPPAEDVDGLRVLRIQGGPKGALRGNLWWWRRAARTALLVHHQEPIDALHAHDLDTLPAAARVQRRTGARLVFDAHEIFDVMIEEDHAWPVVWAARLLERRLLRRVDHVITVNETIADHYRRRGKHVTVVMNCPDVPRARRPRGTFTVTYIGVLHRARFFPDAVHALGGMQGVDVVVAGREGCADEVAAAARAYRNIHFLGAIPSDDVMAKTMEGHAVLCLFDPTHRIHRIGTPNKMFEAMAAGRPGIYARGTHSGDFATDHGTGLAIDYTTDALRTAVAWLRDHPVEARAMGERGRALAKSTYNWPAQARRLGEVYE